MRDVINAQESDLMWRFYCKWFSINGKEVVAPISLCPYFWTSVFGFCLWLGREVRLRSFWAIALASTLLFGASISLSSGMEGVLVSGICLVVTVAWVFTFFAAAFVSMHRLWLLLEERARWVIYLIGAGFLAFILGNAAIQGTLVPDLKNLLAEMFRAMKWGIAVIAILIVAALLFCTIPSSRLSKAQDVFKTFFAYAKARKNGLCPPVNPPPGFRKSGD